MSHTFEGRIWKIDDSEGALMDDVDTDQIFHNSHLAITETSEMGQHALGNLEGWTNFAGEAAPGDIMMFGENFGSGSSRQQAVDCFSALGVSCIIARSFGAIYKRNAINSGLPVLELLDIDLDALSTGDRIVVNIDACMITLEGVPVGSVKPMPGVQRDIMDAGNLFLYAKRMEGEE